jgi:glycosyltransferase involved in cell wall biosynthesis
MYGSAASAGPHARGRVRVDGKQFALDGERFLFRGVTYGTFRPRSSDGERFPERWTVDADFREIRANGFTVVRTYTVPPDDVIESAAEHGLYLLAGAFHPDLRYLIGASRRDRRRVASEWQREIGSVTKRLCGVDNVLALCLGNEIPADVIRWTGAGLVSKLVDELAYTVRSADPSRLVTYANYPTAEYLALDGLDFLTFNVYLDRQVDFRRYLTRLQNLAGDRPLVLGELGLDSGPSSGGEIAQAEALSWQLETAVERGVAGTCVFSWTDEWWVGTAAVEDWAFGLTRSNRTAKPSLDVASAWNDRDVSDLDAEWPSMSIVICAYNAQSTIDECLTHTCALDYPNLEIIVVDDGSCDKTAEIAARHSRVRLITIPHGGLSVARNEGLRAARGELIAYLDSDAFPPAEWPYFLALGLDDRRVGGTGGPNIAPPSDSLGAQAVARAPGGPAHVLFTDDRAEHLPGCNMAFWREVLEEVGGFDPVYTSAGDDVDLCWKVIDAGWEIGFHPAALVWHHRRSGTRAFLRQQRGYGRAESLVAARHPHRFTDLGTARWRGHIYVPGAPKIGRDRIYHGPLGTSAYQSVYRTPSHALDVVHQGLVPAAAAAVAISPLVAYRPAFAVAPLAILLAIVALFVADTARASAPRELVRGRLAFRMKVAWLHLLQPAARWWGRARSRGAARRQLPKPAPLPGPMTKVRSGVLMVPATQSRDVIARSAIGCLASAGLRVVPGSGWEPYDALIGGSSFVRGQLLTSGWPEGVVQIRVRRIPRRLALAAALGSAVTLQLALHVPVALAGAAIGIEWLRGAWRLGPRARAVLRAAAFEFSETPSDDAVIDRRPSATVSAVARFVPDLLDDVEDGVRT